MEGVGIPFLGPSAAYTVACAARREGKEMRRREPTRVLEVESVTAEECLPYVELFVRHDYWETLRKFETVDQVYDVRYLSNEKRDIDWVKFGPHCALSDMYNISGDWLFFTSKYGMCGMQMVYAEEDEEGGEEEECGGAGGEVEMPRLLFFINMGMHRWSACQERPLGGQTVGAVCGHVSCGICSVEDRSHSRLLCLYGETFSPQCGQGGHSKTPALLWQAGVAGVLLEACGCARGAARWESPGTLERRVSE